MKPWPLRGRRCQGSGLLVSAALLVAAALSAGAAFVASGASGSRPLPQVWHDQGARVGPAPRFRADKSSRSATAIPPWLLLGCALTFLRCGSRSSSRSWLYGRRVGAAVSRGTRKHLRVALGRTQLCAGDVPVSAAPWAAVASPAVPRRPQRAVMTSNCGNMAAPPNAPWALLPSMTAQLCATGACEAAPSTSSSLQSKPRPARFVGGVRHGSCSQRPRSSNTATRATRKQIGSRLKSKAAEIEVPQLPYDVSRLRRALQVGLRAQHQRRSERPRESSTPSNNSSLREQSGELHTALSRFGGCQEALPSFHRSSGLQFHTPQHGMESQS
mmetsp:Transcript_76278/g.177043  ORF Transcript_76278/g.177043 Transcript_76278/m.177043 type:complete len:329 (-) Transcript_76278:90-1076(-)